MGAVTDNETWLGERGRQIIENVKGDVGRINGWERLVFCLWVADYMMNNAGDFANAEVMYPSFQADAAQISLDLSLLATYDAFSLSRADLQSQYFDRFEAMCDEIRRAEPADSSGS